MKTTAALQNSAPLAPALAQAAPPGNRCSRRTSRDRANTAATIPADAPPGLAILGVTFDSLTLSQTVARIEAMVASRRPHYVVTPNVDFLVQAREDVELRRILTEADLVLCDGTPLVWASRALGNPLPERVAGADLIPCLIQTAAEKQFRIFLLGATPESAGRAAARLQEQYPALRDLGYYSPPFKPLLDMDHEEIKRRILKAAPDLLFVSFGCPKQEKWIAMHYRELGVPVTIGVGATIDFLAGSVRRAPSWMQKTGTEWLYRLAQEPRRLYRRYGRDLSVFGRSILAQWWRLEFPALRKQAPAGSFKPGNSDDQFCCLRPPPRLDLAAVRQESARVKDLFTNRHCILEMTQVEFIDSTGVGFLIAMRKQLRASGCELVLLAPCPAVERALRLMRLQDLLPSAPNFESAKRLVQARVQQELVLTDHSAAGAIVWRGDIRAADADRVWQRTLAHLTALGPAAPWRIDLSSVGFIDSTGLGLMVRARKLAETRGKELAFTNPPPAVRNVVRLARLEQHLLGH